MPRKPAPAPKPQPQPQEHPLMAKLDGPRQEEARRLGLDLDLLDGAEFAAFRSKGAAGLSEYRQQMWNEEAAKRPPRGM